MNEEQIKKDRQGRVEKAKAEMEAILRKYELDLTAEDMIGENTKIKVMVQFVDTKKYPTAKLAQEENAIIDDLLNPKGDKINGKKR